MVAAEVGVDALVRICRSWNAHVEGLIAAVFSGSFLVICPPRGHSEMVGLPVRSAEREVLVLLKKGVVRR